MSRRQCPTCGKWEMELVMQEVRSGRIAEEDWECPCGSTMHTTTERPPGPPDPPPSPPGEKFA